MKKPLRTNTVWIPNRKARDPLGSQKPKLRPTTPLLEKDWPDDLPDYVFLGRAIQRYGHVVHQSDWVGDETATSVGDAWRTDSMLTLSHDQQDLAQKIFEEVFPSDAYLFIEEWDDQQWRSVLDQQWRRAAAHKRWVTTAKALVTDFRAGRIKTFGRDKRGGPLGLIEPHFWNFERWHRRMVELDIDMADPFDTMTVGDQLESRTARYVYVDGEDLDRLASGWSADMPTPAQWAALSPYLRFAVAAATKIGADVLKTGTRKLIVGKLKELNVPKPSHGTHDQKAQAIASVIRFPASEMPGRRPIKKTL